jgi:hypothetical protein
MSFVKFFLINCTVTYVNRFVSSKIVLKSYMVGLHVRVLKRKGLVEME